MTVTVRFSDGQILDVTLYDGADTVACISSHSRHIRHCVLLYAQGKIQVYKFMRRNRRDGPVRTLLNTIETNLQTHYNIEVKGLIWGQPAVTFINSRWVWALNETLIIDQYGNLSVAFTDLLTRYGISAPDTSDLLSFFEASRNIAPVTTIEPTSPSV